MGLVGVSPEPSVIAGRFEVRRRLGAGGFGIVYEVLDRDQQAVVALKTLLRSDGDSLYRLKREFRSLADISHPNLITLYELLSDGAQWFFTMELIEGVDFLRYVAESRSHVPTTESDNAPTRTMAAPFEGGAATAPADFRPNPERLRSALRQLACAVSALHHAGQLHLDLKPSNVLVSTAGRVVVLDFGLSSDKSVQGHDHRPVVGTPAYMAPEQASGKPLSEAADWYSAGVMLFQALTGRKPFIGLPEEVVAQKLREDPPAPSSFAPDVPGDLESLCLELLRRDPERRPAGNEVLRRLGLGAEGMAEADMAPDSPFVGRTQQLETLRKAFESVRSGHAARVVVHGRSGIGKSAFVHHFLDGLRTREDCLVLAGRCYEQEFARYQALDSVVDALSKYLPSLPLQDRLAILPRDASLLALMFPVLKDLVDPLPASSSQYPLDQRELRVRAFACMRSLLGNLARRNRVVVFIDDVHWSDADSAPLLAELLRPPDPPPLLWITCRRSPEAASPAAGAPADAGAIEIGLEELSREESRELAAAVVRASPNRLEAVARESGGNPLFLCELARHSARASEPMQMEQVFEERIAGLAEPARRTLEIAAVAGRPVPREIARQAAELGPLESPVLAQLRGARLLRTRSAEGLPEIEIYHDRIRAVVLAGVPPEVLRDRHGRLASALEQSGRADPETLMTHFQSAGDLARTAKYAIAAGERSAAALAFSSAAGFYRVALETGNLERSRAAEVRLRLADSLANAGRGSEAAAIYQSAAAGETDAEEQVEVLRRAASQHLLSGHPAPGLELMRDVLGRVGLDAPASSRRSLVRLAWRRLRIALRGYRYRERSGAEIDPRELLRIDVCWSAAQGLAMTDLFQAAAFHGVHLILALRAGEPYRVARALCVEAGYFALAGPAGERKCAALLETASAIAGRIGNPHSIGLARLVSGMAAFLSGRWKQSRGVLEEAEEILREKCVGVAWELATARLMHSVSLFFLGELRQIGERLPALLASAEARGDIYEATDLRIRISHATLLALDRAPAALEEVERAVAGWPRDRFYLQHWWSLIARTEIHLYSGDGAAAWDLVTKTWPALRRSLLLGAQYIRVESLYHRACAGIAMGGGRGLRRAAKDAARLRRERAPWTAPLSDSVYAGVAAARGSMAEAAALLERAESGYQGVDMKLFAAAARRHRGALIGGDTGRDLVASAERCMEAEGIRNPPAMAAMLVPVFSASEPRA